MKETLGEIFDDVKTAVLRLIFLIFIFRAVRVLLLLIVKVRTKDNGIRRNVLLVEQPISKNRQEAVSSL